MDAKKVTAENKRLLALFDGVDANKLDFVREHVRQLSWYNVEIAQLQQNIEKDGISVQYQNGRNQTGWQNNPDLKALCELQKLASAMIKTLLPLVPDKTGKSLKQSIWEDFEAEETDPVRIAERERRDREYEERRKKAEEDLQRAIEQQRREREQKNNNGLNK